MDRKQQAEHVKKMIDEIARKTIALPSDARAAFIKGEIAKVRGIFLRTYEADSELIAAAMTYLDTMYGEVKARVRFLERNSSDPGAV
jgi:hypothetical protein